MNGKLSSWTEILGDVSHDSMLKLIIIIIFIKQLLDNFSLRAKTFTDDSKLFHNSPEQHVLL